MFLLVRIEFSVGCAPLVYDISSLTSNLRLLEICQGSRQAVQLTLVCVAKGRVLRDESHSYLHHNLLWRIAAKALHIDEGRFRLPSARRPSPTIQVVRLFRPVRDRRSYPLLLRNSIQRVFL